MEKREKASEKRTLKSGKNKQTIQGDQAEFSLLADEKSFAPKLSSLFAAKPTPPQSRAPVAASSAKDDQDEIGPVDDTTAADVPEEPQAVAEIKSTIRKRKRKDQDDDLEDNYMRKLARQDEQDSAKVQDEKRHAAISTLKTSAAEDESDQDGDNSVPLREDLNDNDAEEEAEDDWKPPQHESITATSLDVDKAGRTVFISNVSITAVTTKAARKAFEKHLASFFEELPETNDKTRHKLESLRFRSTPYDPSLPKRAAFARGEVMTTTTQSTNAYAVYSTSALARTACRKLNGSVILDRHIRVDSVAHPAPVDHKRCVFVGNLGFVDDETNIIAANEAAGREKRKQNQKPSDVEEGLWRLFAKHGTVESVRVIRDKGTRVGKGIAYVQFTDQNGVEGALSEDGKKDPPRLPRTLRVSRAKAMKRSKTAPRQTAKDQPEGYRRKVTPGEASLRGRVGKLMGKAAAAMARPDFKTPESFVFEGHRASSKQGKTGLKLGKPNNRKAKPTGRSAKRTAAYKAGTVKKKASS